MKNFYIAKSRRLRGTKYTSRVEKQGVTSYTVYNHMLLPASFGSIESLYHHLKEDVQVWDAAVQRQLEISGKDSSKLVQMMTCRDLSKAKEGRCYYCPIIDNKGGVINSKPEDIYSSINFLLKISTSIALGGRSSSTPSGKLQRIFELIY